MRPARSPIDLPGVVLASSGLFALVYGFSSAETNSWSAPITIAALAASAVLLAGFIVLERRVEHPLLPLHIVWDRARGGAYATIALAGSAVFAVFLFLTYFMQQNLGYSPVQTGVAFLPMTIMIVLTATTVQTRVLARTGAKPLVVAGMALGGVAMIIFAQLTPDASYASHILPGLLLTGVGMGCVFAPAFSTATLGVKSSDAGIASAMVNTSQQVGGSVGTALLSTIFASAAASFASAHAKTSGLVAGFGPPWLHDRVLLGRGRVRHRIARCLLRPPLAAHGSRSRDRATWRAEPQCRNRLINRQPLESHHDHRIDPS